MMNGQNVVYLYHEILLSHKKKWNIETYYNMDETQKYYANQRKTDTKGHMSYNLIYMKYSELVSL